MRRQLWFGPQGRRTWSIVLFLVQKRVKNNISSVTWNCSPWPLKLLLNTQLFADLPRISLITVAWTDLRGLVSFGWLAWIMLTSHCFCWASASDLSCRNLHETSRQQMDELFAAKIRSCCGWREPQLSLSFVGWQLLWFTMDINTSQTCAASDSLSLGLQTSSANLHQESFEPVGLV